MSLHLPIFLAALFLAGPLGADGDKTTEEHRIGVMVKAVAAALKAPGKPESLETIAEYGTLTEHYTMIRGWLVQELKGVESQLEATRDPEQKRPFEIRARFLRQAIRRIDLE